MYRKARGRAIVRHNEYSFSTCPMTSTNQLSSEEIINATRSWVEKAVIGLNLCPFAKAVYVREQIRYVVSSAATPLELHADLVAELSHLHEADPHQTDTTLLIHPFMLADFLDYNDFLDIADSAIDDLGLTGEIQIASFHPQYQFADTTVDDIGNYTNRSPYPLLHLLRETSIAKAVAAFPDAAEIFNKNIETMRRLGHDGWNALNASAMQPLDVSLNNKKPKN